MLTLKFIAAFILNTIFFSCFAQEKDKPAYKEKYRPQYHLTSPKGALFDPTALVYVNGYYQVNQRLAISKDLVHWKLEKRQRLNTDSTREMSGSVVIDEQNSSGFGLAGKPPLVAVYSALRPKDGRQFQCIAWSNDEGKTWTQYDKNPVIDIGSTEFRDPQVFWYQPSGKWIMIVALSSKQQVRFYSSTNLKDWEFLSDFGPLGAVKGVWECPDIFPLAVDGNKQNIKWLLEVDVQPIGGQYFLGDFDGQKFTIDSSFNSMLEKLKKDQPEVKGNVLFDFENDLVDWKKEGGAFSASPANGSLEYQNAVIGFEGKKLINSFYNKDAATGKIISPSFLINNKYINFLIGGGDHPNETCINLIVDNKVVATKTGVNTEVLYWAGWDVEKYIGKKANVEIVDSNSGPFGHILVDKIILADEPAINEKEATTWIDYGPDFYAERSWVNAPNNRRIWVAWMGSWLYATSVPTKPWKGGHTFPREVTLKTFPEGIRMVQNPVKEIEKLRDKPIHYTNVQINANTSFTIPDVQDNTYEMQVEFEIKDTGSISIELCKGPHEKTILTYYPIKEVMQLDRTHSGETRFSVSFPHSYEAPLKIRNNKVRFHILVDHSSIEVFGNDGESTITCQIFPDPGNKGIEIISDSKNLKLINLDLWQLQSIWNNF
jgi:sucrose-6-phosphate hydrolase SacC (GH32 family)